MVIREKRKKDNKIVIDLTGPQGNAFVLLGYARGFLRSADAQIRDTILQEMMSGDYEKLVQTFDQYFGSRVTLLR